MLRLITLTTFPHLETEHLLLRQIQPSYAEALFVMFSDEVLYGGDAAPPGGGITQPHSPPEALVRATREHSLGCVAKTCAVCDGPGRSPLPSLLAVTPDAGDGRVIDLQASSSSIFSRSRQPALITQIPARAEQNDLGLEVRPLERMLLAHAESSLLVRMLQSLTR